MTQSLYASRHPGEGNARATPPSARGVWRFAALIYWGGAALLIPWIVGLVIAQPNRDDVYRRNLISFGLLFLFTTGAVATGILCQRRSHHALLAATFTTTLMVVAAWFSFLVVHPISALLFKKHVVVLVALAVPVGLMVWVAVGVMRSPTDRWSVPRWVGWACFLFPALIVPLIATRLSSASPVVEAHSMRVAWTGLDLFELAAMIVTGSFIRRRSPWLACSAAALGGLLCCDAWYNVLSSSGLDLVLGIALAFIELPLAVYSFALSARETQRGWT